LGIDTLLFCGYLVEFSSLTLSANLREHLHRTAFGAVQVFPLIFGRFYDFAALPSRGLAQTPALRAGASVGGLKYSPAYTSPTFFITL
jgi:hypothetical protein